MRTMFAVGHLNRTHTRIVIKGGLPEDRRTDAAKREPPVASVRSLREVPAAVTDPRTVH